MSKIILQGILTFLLFFGIWFSMKEIDWMGTLKIQETTDNTEEQLGDVLWDVFSKGQIECENAPIVSALDSIVNHICKANNIEREKIQVHVLLNADINAFALPGGHLIVNTGLINNTEQQEELTGVICHELAHIELNHVMKKLVKEIGLSVLVSIAAGNGGQEIIKESLKLLSSSAFDRSIEKEADIKAVDYLTNAEVNPEPFANFLFKISVDDKPEAKYLSWLGTHPDSKDRAKYIIEYSKSKSANFNPILSDSTWINLKNETNRAVSVENANYL